MSRCEEYREEMLNTEEEIRKLEYNMPPLGNERESHKRRIEALKKEASSWKEKWERSLKRGGC